MLTLNLNEDLHLYVLCTLSETSYCLFRI